jgi:hypothetical protein
MDTNPLAKNRYKTTRTLAVRLSRDELLEIATELARYNEDAKEVENKKAEVNAHFTAELKKAKAEIETSSRKISTGEEYREVECEVILDTKKMKKTIIRIDTGVVVREENITSEDLQMELQMIERKNQ